MAAPVEPAGPMARREVAERVRLAPEQLRPVVRYAVRREPDVAIDIGRSKVGGAPDLPRGTLWPSWVPAGGEKRLLQFFAQLDLAEAAAAAPAELGLPACGLLSFFADFDPASGSVPGSVPGPEAVAILYTPAEALLLRLGLRMVPVATAQLHPLGTWYWPSPADGAAFDREHEAGLRERAPNHYEMTARHQLGGHAGDDDGANLPLLQLDSDPLLELAWGPGGAPARLLWTVPAAGVARHDWAGAGFRVVPSSGRP